MFASLFVLLYVAHLAADYPFQTDHQAAHKAKPGITGWRANITHAATHVVLCALVLAVAAFVLDIRPAPSAVTIALAWIGATHAVIDRRWPITWWMNNTGQREFVKHGGAAHVDQTAHVLALAAAALLLAA